MIKKRENNRTSPIGDLQSRIPLNTPQMLYIDPCGACNLKCTFCPCNTETILSKERHKVMGMELFQKIVNDLKEFPEKVEIAYLYGFGEPLLNPLFCDMVKLLKNKVNKIRTVSNGVLLNEKINSELVESGLDYIRISVEALSTDGYIKVANTNVDFDKFVSNIADLYAKSRGKMEIGIRIISAGLDSEAEAQKFYDIFEPISDYASIDNIRDIWPESDAGKEKTGGYIDVDSYYEQGGSICSSPLYSLTIHSNGVVSACPDDWIFKKKIGDASQESLYSIWNSETLKNVQTELIEKGRKNIPFCSECGWKAVVDIDDYAEEILKKLKG